MTCEGKLSFDFLRKEGELEKYALVSHAPEHVKNMQPNRRKKLRKK